MSKTVQEYLESGMYLPSFMRDFHDQKDVFKMLDDVRKRSIAKNGGSYMANMSFVDAQVYTIDIFLWVMAMHGYTLQRSRKKLPFSDINETVEKSAQIRRQEMWSLIGVMP